MAEGKQLNLRMDADFVEQLERDAIRFGLMGKNTAATQIIETYYEHWKAMQEEILQVRQAHLAKLKKQPPKRLAG